MSLAELTEAERPICYGVIQPGAEDENGVKLIRGGDVVGGKIAASLRTISQTVSEQYTRTILKGGELLVGLVGYPGETALVPIELAGANIARQVAMVALRSDVNREYVRQYLGSPSGKAALLRPTIGSAQQVINIADLKKVTIPLPDPSDQQRVSEILTAADLEMELSIRRTELLQRLKEAIMQQLFSNSDHRATVSQGTEN